jgi:hypothetical protein
MRKKSLLIALAILALGLIGTSFSELYVQNQIVHATNEDTVNVSYGFPLSWHGYSQSYLHRMIAVSFPENYWFSLESLLLDAAFWFAISFFLCIATMKSVNILHKTRACY